MANAVLNTPRNAVALSSRAGTASASAWLTVTTGEHYGQILAGSRSVDQMQTAAVDWSMTIAAQLVEAKARSLMRPGAFAELVVRASRHVFFESADAVEHQMLMTIDQPRQQRHITQIHRCRLGDVCPHGHDHTTSDDDACGFDEPVTIEQSLRLDHHTR